MTKDPPNPQCNQTLTQERLLPFAFTLAFTILAYYHCRWACDPLISSALAYNLINACSDSQLVLGARLGVSEVQMESAKDVETVV